MVRRLYDNVDDTLIKCPDCGGTGQILDPKDPSRVIACPICHGRGRRRKNASASAATSNHVTAQRKPAKKESSKSAWVTTKKGQKLTPQDVEKLKKARDAEKRKKERAKAAAARAKAKQDAEDLGRGINPPL